ncbi:MAG: hypothetical protein ACFFFK_07580 [Candidatus Thorarchaeota archaeon]
MGTSFIKRMLRLVTGSKRREDTNVTVVERPKVDVPRVGEDIYDSIMKPVAKTATEEDIDSTVAAIAFIMEGIESDTDKTDPEWPERRDRIIIVCHEILEMKGQHEEKIGKIRELLHLTSGLTATALFSIRLREMTHS